MPRINFTIPDSSPIITYAPAGAWGDSDAATGDYTNGTFHFTQTPNAYLSFKFNGTGVSLYGALRGNHDEFSVAVDGGHQLSANGHTDVSPGVFNASLYSVGGLTYGTHEVVLMNTPGPAGGYVDLDWAVVEIGDGDATTSNTDFWLDDTASNFTYGQGWTAGGASNYSPQYYNSSFHLANTDGAQTTFDFYGNGVQLYGAASSNHGIYTVSLDGGMPVTYNGQEVAFRAQQLLYLASGLASGPHKVVISNVGTNYTDLDYAIVSRYSGNAPLPAPLSASGSSLLPSVSPSAPAPPSSSPSGTSASGTHTSSYGPGPTPTPPSPTPASPTPTVPGTGSITGSATGTALNPSNSSGASPRSRVGATALGLLGICSVLFGAL